MYKSRSGQWKWYFSVPVPGISTPAELMRDAAVIKDHPAVKVFKKDGYFFKWETPQEKHRLKKWCYRFSSRGRKEFKILQKVIRQGFAATEPLGFGCCGIQSVLITKELSGFQPVAGYLSDRYEKGEDIPADFLRSWGDFAGRFVVSGFYFPDFHCGNLMYHAGKKEFALVDLYGVRKVLFSRQRRQERMLFRQLKDAMVFLNDEQLFLVLQSAGWMERGGSPESFLEYAAQSVREFLPRRLKALRNRKFSLRPDGKKWNFAAGDQYRLTPAEVEKVWENALLCQLFGIPHIHLTGYSDDGVVSGEKFYIASGENDRQDLKKRLAAAGLPLDEFTVVFRENQTAAVADRRLLKRA